MVPQDLLEDLPTPTGPAEPPERAVPIRHAPGAVRAAAPALPGAPSLYSRAAEIARRWLLTFFWLMLVGSFVALVAFYQVGLAAGLDENEAWAPALGAGGGMVAAWLPLVAAAHITTRVLEAKANSTAADV